MDLVKKQPATGKPAAGCFCLGVGAFLRKNAGRRPYPFSPNTVWVISSAVVTTLELAE